MELLNFLSFHTWKTYLSESTSGLVYSLFIVIVIILVIKIFTNVSMDSKGKYGGVKSTTSAVGRILNVSLYIVLLSIVSLFNSPTFFILTEAAMTAYLVIIGVMCIDCDRYVSRENTFIVELEHQFEVYVENNKTKKQKINSINKRIYDYKKRAIIG